MPLGTGVDPRQALAQPRAAEHLEEPPALQHHARQHEGFGRHAQGDGVPVRAGGLPGRDRHRVRERYRARERGGDCDDAGDHGDPRRGPRGGPARGEQCVRHQAARQPRAPGHDPAQRHDVREGRAGDARRAAPRSHPGGHGGDCEHQPRRAPRPQKEAHALGDCVRERRAPPRREEGLPPRPRPTPEGPPRARLRLVHGVKTHGENER
mmetsp:Transcript_21081/g.68209  ORF Transcript_21081/g.68209 Transcript_21081/m.68209 type:complete len:209 (+) Transcript_21081:438-1064(+)